MQYKVTIKNKAVKQSMTIPPRDREKVYDGIKKLENSETWGDVRRLVNHIYDYRLRVGNYRALFNIIDSQLEIKEISVEEIKKRDDHTY